MFVDRRLHNTPRYYLQPPKDFLMIVPKDLVQSVAFIGQRLGATEKIGGTGFFVSIPTTVRRPGSFIYFVTARHVVEDKNDLFVRLNHPDGGTFPLNLPDSDDPLWLRLDDLDAGEDYCDAIAAPVDLGASLVLWRAGYRWVPISMFFDEADLGFEIEPGKVGLGDEVFAIGLLTVHYGTNENSPVVRIGNLAMTPKDPVLVRYRNGPDRSMSLYLTELRSIAGLSGSPTFVEHRHYLDASEVPLSLLGLMIGHWDDPDANHMGFGKVVPARLIHRLLNQEAEVKRREEAEREHLPEDGIAELDSNIEQESEYDRFERLARELANTPKPEKND